MRPAIASASVTVSKINARERILNEAAKHFSRYGFVGASTRDIAKAAGMKAGSLYYHFDSKETLLLEVEREAFRRVEKRVSAALEGVCDPWDRLTAACGAHLEAVLQNREYIDVTSRELPNTRSRKTRRTFRALRRDYEQIFRDLIDRLPLDADVDRTIFRLTLLGALAWSLVWYRPSGPDAPEETAEKIVALLRYGATASAGEEKVFALQSV